MTRIGIVQPSLNAVSETFIRAHDERLPGVAGVVYLLNGRPAMDGGPVLSQSWSARARRKVYRTVFCQPWEWEIDHAYKTAFRRAKADVILVEYGTTALQVVKSCQSAGLPLVVHFHGYDASRHDVVEAHAADYRKMFNEAAAVIVVSRAMERRLLSLGCPAEKTIYNPCGIDCDRFVGGKRESSEMMFVAVGRMVEKKAPYLTLAAFARMLDDIPDARLRMIGDGELLGVCRDLAGALGIDHAVTLLGAQSHEVVQLEMRQALAFVQHSITAANGDTEGTPVAVLEAGAMGLPVVATRHAGIPDVVIEGETGLLINERDVIGMADHMLSLARNPQRAGELGRNAAVHVRKYYTMEQSIRRLSRVLQAAANAENISAVRAEIEAEFPSPRTTPAVDGMLRDVASQ